MSNVPEPIRAALDSFKALAHNPPLYIEAVQALHFSVMEIAAEIGPCPSCGADTAAAPKHYPIAIAICARGTEYCKVCGETAIDDPQPENFRDHLGRDTRYEPDWDSIVKYRDN